MSQIVKKIRLIFGLTTNYTALPVIRKLANDPAANRPTSALIQVEYAQDWLTTPLRNTGKKSVGVRPSTKAAPQVH